MQITVPATRSNGAEASRLSLPYATRLRPPEPCHLRPMEAAIARRLDQQDRRLARLERDVGAGVETLALFIRFWLNTTPPLPEPAAKAARAQAGAPYDNFVATLWSVT